MTVVTPSVWSGRGTLSRKKCRAVGQRGPLEQGGRNKSVEVVSVVEPH